MYRDPNWYQFEQPMATFLSASNFRSIFSSRFRGNECILSISSPSLKTCSPSCSPFSRSKQFSFHRTGQKRPDTKKTHLKWFLMSPVGGCSAKCVVASTLLPLLGSLRNRRLTKIHFFYENIPRMIAKRSFLYGPKCQQSSTMYIQSSIHMNPSKFTSIHINSCKFK